jgi:RNA polymerase sigma-70 factor, ECF subfamily
MVVISEISCIASRSGRDPGPRGENFSVSQKILSENRPAKPYNCEMDELPPSPDTLTESYLRLLTQNDRWLATYVHSLVPRAADADDILQEVKVTMWKHFAKFEPGTNFRAWARRIATNQILNYRRSTQRNPSTELEASFIEAVAAEIDRRADGLDQRSEALRHCLHKLPEAHRKIIVWRYYEDCGVEEIAKKSQRSTEAVYQLLSRIRGLLNDCVSRQLAHQP